MHASLRTVHGVYTECESSSPLVIQLAALNGFEELVRLLLASGADPLSKNEVAK